MRRNRSHSVDSIQNPSPLEELTIIMNRLDERVFKVREAHRNILTPTSRKSRDTSNSPKKGLGSRFLRKKAPSHPTTTNKGSDDENDVLDNSGSPPVTPGRIQFQETDKQPTAEFISFQTNDDKTDGEAIFVEDLRRLAEICVIGENYASNIEKRRIQRKQMMSVNPCESSDTTDLDGSESGENDRESGAEEKLLLFDLFFEKNGLELLVSLLTGKTFQIDSGDETNIGGKSDSGGLENEVLFAPSSTTISTPDRSPRSTVNVNDLMDRTGDKIMLPPLRIAIQALQSISILIQNVSRANSLYMIFSNNHINDLINLPLHLYTIAEQRRHTSKMENKQTSSTFSSQIDSELATHFVTFLKCLAMRMNAQTLQFFLKYPMEPSPRRSLASDISNPNNQPRKHVLRRSSSEKFLCNNRTTTHSRDKPRRSKSEQFSTRSALIVAAEGDSIKLPERPLESPIHFLKDFANEEAANYFFNVGTIPQKLEKTLVVPHVEFPLYEKALEFCGPHNDSFVRLTAMNICLNTLRLVTVSDADAPSVSDCHDTPDKSLSPDGVLHNAEALPFRERAVIARFACMPTRVERLVSPIFAKLAERWGAIEEHIRAFDFMKKFGKHKSPMSSSSFGNIEKRLDEQTPQEIKIKQERLVRVFNDKAADMLDELLILEDVFKVGLTVFNEQCIEMMLATFVYPLLLQPLLNYVNELVASVDESRFTFTDHPFGGMSVDLSDISAALLPVSAPAKTALFTIGYVFQTLTNQPLLRLLFTVLMHPLSPDPNPAVSCKLEIAMIDLKGAPVIRLDHNFASQSNNNITYGFGRAKDQTPASDIEIEDEKDNAEACIFVLAPALAEILERSDLDEITMSSYRPNPYRNALLKCLQAPDDMSDIRELAACSFDTVVSVFDETFIARIMYGCNVLKRGVAGHDAVPGVGAPKEPPKNHSMDNSLSIVTDSLHKDGFFKPSLITDIVTALVDCTVFAKRISSNDWKLGYDNVGVHALLASVKGNTFAAEAALSRINVRKCQAATQLFEKPSCGLLPMGGSNNTIHGAPTVNDSSHEDRMFDFFMNYVFFESVNAAGNSIAEEVILHMDDVFEQCTLDSLMASVCFAADSKSLADRVVGVLGNKVDETRNKLPFERSTLDERRETVIACLRLDALGIVLKFLASGDKSILSDNNFAGRALTCKSSVVETRNREYARYLICPLSREVSGILFNLDRGTQIPSPLSSINLANYEMLPCVCEAPASAAHLFSDEISGVVAEGVTWQSLYIVFVDDFLVFAQPYLGLSGGLGRVISSCALSNVFVQNDRSTPQPGGPARRLMLSYVWFEKAPPPLFLFDIFPKQVKKSPPFSHLSKYTSHLDVWFEHQRAADYAFRTIASQIFHAKARRGSSLQASFVV